MSTPEAIRAASDRALNNKLATVRAKIDRTLADIDGAKDAPRPVEEATAVVMQSFDRIAAASHGANILRNVLFDNPDGEQFDLDNERMRGVPGYQIQALALLIGRDTIERNAHALLSQVAATQAPAIRSAERMPKLSALTRTLRELEVEEETIILDLEAADDVFVERRNEANPVTIVAAWRKYYGVNA